MSGERISWAKWEDQSLRALWRTGDQDKLMAELPGREWNEITSRARALKLGQPDKPKRERAAAAAQPERVGDDWPDSRGGAQRRDHLALSGEGTMRRARRPIPRIEVRELYERTNWNWGWALGLYTVLDVRGNQALMGDGACRKWESVFNLAEGLSWRRVEPAGEEAS